MSIYPSIYSPISSGFKEIYPIFMESLYSVIFRYLLISFRYTFSIFLISIIGLISENIGNIGSVIVCHLWEVTLVFRLFLKVFLGFHRFLKITEGFLKVNEILGFCSKGTEGF